MGVELPLTKKDTEEALVNKISKNYSGMEGFCGPTRLPMKMIYMPKKAKNAKK